MRRTGFGAWRAAALDRTQHVDLLRLAEHSIEADLARRDRTINTTAQALRAVTTSIRSAGWGPASGTAADALVQAFVEDPLRTLRIAGSRPSCPSPSIPESAMAARAGSVVLDWTAPERIFAELKRVVIADRALDGLGARCQMPLPEARENGSESRGRESRSAPLRRTSATNLVRENADFGWAGRDAAKNTTLLALIDTLGGTGTVSPERNDLLGVEDRHYHPPRRAEHTRAVSERDRARLPSPSGVSEGSPCGCGPALRAADLRAHRR